jgi:pyrroline-5-carboxylate reductase
MAGAMLTAFLNAGKIESEKVVIISSDLNKFSELNSKYNCQVKLLEQCKIADKDLLLIGIKPQIFAQNFEAIKNQITGNAICISIMAGVNCQKLAELRSDLQIIRLMPNLPVTVGHGITGMYLASALEQITIDFVETLLKTTGSVFKADTEEQIDSLTALTGSGPAYLYTFMEALVASAKGFGFDQNLANKLVTDLIEGAFLYLKNYQTDSQTIDLKQLRESVTSKGGTTEAALKVLESGNFAELIIKALVAAKEQAGKIATRI